MWRLVFQSANFISHVLCIFYVCVIVSFKYIQWYFRVTREPERERGREMWGVRHHFGRFLGRLCCEYNAVESLICPGVFSLSGNILPCNGIFARSLARSSCRLLFWSFPGFWPQAKWCVNVKLASIKNCDPIIVISSWMKHAIFSIA